MEDDEELHNSLRQAILDEFRNMSLQLNDDMDSFSSHDAQSTADIVEKSCVSLSDIFANDDSGQVPVAELSKNELPLRPEAQPLKPSWWTEEATQRAYRFVYRREFNRWDENEVEIRISPEPFAVGPTRAAYCMKITDGVFNSASDTHWPDVSDFVVKLYVDMAPLAKEQRSDYLHDNRSFCM